MKILILLFFIVLSIESYGQNEISLSFGGGNTIWTPPGHKPDQSLNYGANLHYYFLNRGIASFGLQSGVQVVRNKLISHYNNLAGEYKKETTFQDVYIPLYLIGKIVTPSGWFNELAIGGYFSDYQINLTAGLGTGYQIRLSDSLNLPVKVRADYMNFRDPWRPWDGIINCSLNVGIALYL